MAKFNCPKCSGALVDQAVPELMGDVEDRGLVVLRSVLGHCLRCGWQHFSMEHEGHHSTYGESYIQRRYPKLVRGRMKKFMTAEVLKIFLLAKKGRHWPTQEELETFDSAAAKTGAQLRPSDNQQLAIFTIE